MDIHVNLIDDPPVPAPPSVPPSEGRDQGSARDPPREEATTVPPQRVQRIDTFARDEITFKPLFDLVPRTAEQDQSLAIALRTAPERLRLMWDKWFPGRDPGQPMWNCDDNIAQMFAAVGIDRTSKFTADEVNNKFKTSLTAVAELMLELERSGTLQQENHEAMVRLILQKVEATRIGLLAMYRLCVADSMLPSDLPRGDFGLWRFIPPSADDDDEKPSPSQRLRMFAINDIMHWGYRRYRESLMVRVNAPDGNSTCAWKVAITIDDYVRSLTSRRLTNTKVWFDLTSGQGTAVPEGLAKWLKYSDDPEVPWLEPDRHVFSFRNGVYLANEEKFIPYNILPTIYAKESYPVACRHFDVDFNIHWLEYDDPMQIPTPAMDQIFTTQHLSPDVIRWSFALFGRLLYDVHEFDDWQIVPFIKGLANTGKSCLLKFLSGIYDPQDVGYISNMIERQFGLGQIAGKYLAIADDIRQNFQMDQSDFQNITTGGSVSVAVKNQRPKLVDWITPIVFSGNVVPGYHDNSGSFSRRVAVIPFNHGVVKPDGSLSMRMAQEMPAFIVKANWQYRNMVRRYGNAGIWTILPEEFMAQRTALTETSNALVGFLASNLVKKAQGLYMPLGTLRDAVMAHAVRNNIDKPKWGSDYYLGPLTTEGFAVGCIRERKPYPRFSSQSITDTFVYGLDLQANHREGPPPASSSAGSSSSSHEHEHGHGSASEAPQMAAAAAAATLAAPTQAVPVRMVAQRPRLSVTPPPCSFFPPSHP